MGKGGAVKCRGGGFFEDNPVGYCEAIFVFPFHALAVFSCKITLGEFRYF
jgi:hypothetical protein